MFYEITGKYDYGLLILATASNRRSLTEHAEGFYSLAL